MDHLERWIATYKTTEEERREFYYSIAEGLVDFERRCAAAAEKKNGSSVNADSDKNLRISGHAKEWLMKYLKSEQTMSVKVISAIENLVSYTLKLSYDFDVILELPIVKEASKLNDSSSTKKILELVALFVKGDCLPELEGFMGQSGNEELIEEKLKLEKQILISKMQVLTLCKICQNRSEVPLAEIREKMKVAGGNDSVTSVEDIVIQATHNNVITGRIDMERGTLLVENVIALQFGKKEWESLDSNLAMWIAKIEKLQDMHSNPEAFLPSGVCVGA
jgi:hypothetical protein